MKGAVFQEVKTTVHQRGRLVKGSHRVLPAYFSCNSSSHGLIVDASTAHCRMANDNNKAKRRVRSSRPQRKRSVKASNRGFPQYTSFSVESGQSRGQTTVYQRGRPVVKRVQTAFS